MDHPTTTLPRGLLIVLEGLDRSGKSSQCEQLVEALRSKGQKVRHVKFPDRTTPTGQMINNYLTGQARQDDHSIHLLFSANRWEASQSIREDLLNGVTVIVDRYSFSGAVYSAAKDNPDLSLDWAWSPEIGLLKPDILFFLDLPAAEAAKRGGYGIERYETTKMQARVRILYKELFSRLNDVHIRMVDAARSMSEVATDIRSAIPQELPNAAGPGQLRKLGPLLKQI